jgi:hypothetical protein
MKENYAWVPIGREGIAHADHPFSYPSIFSRRENLILFYVYGFPIVPSGTIHGIGTE